MWKGGLRELERESSGSNGETRSKVKVSTPHFKKSTGVCYFLHGRVLILRGYQLKQPHPSDQKFMPFLPFPNIGDDEFHGLMGL